jgi:hypothetical protein
MEPGLKQCESFSSCDPLITTIPLLFHGRFIFRWLLRKILVYFQFIYLWNISSQFCIEYIAESRKLRRTAQYCGVAPRGRSIERPLLINGCAYLAVSLPDNGPVDSNS